MQDVCGVRSLRSANCWTAVHTKIRLVIKVAARNSTTVKLQKSMPKERDKLCKLKLKFRLIKLHGKKIVIGLVVRQKKLWAYFSVKFVTGYNENDKVIKYILTNKSKIRERMLQKDSPRAFSNS